MKIKAIFILLFIIFTNNYMLKAEIPDSTALLIIDIQYFYFEGGKIPLEHPVETSIQAKKVLEKFRLQNKTVIHIQHVPKNPAQITKQHDIHENVKPLANEKIFQKNYANSFKETGLLEYLKSNNIKRIVICGMQTHMCVEAATRAAADYGFECIVIDDACTTRNLTYNDKTVKASDVHYAVLAALSNGYAKISTTDKFLKEY